MRNDPQWETNSDARLHPDSIAKAYKYLVEQDSSALTWELDRRCHHQRDRQTPAFAHFWPYFQFDLPMRNGDGILYSWMII